jgi:hypothetical protein
MVMLISKLCIISEETLNDTHFRCIDHDGEGLDRQSPLKQIRR